MGKLSDYLAMKRDLAFDFERELRAVRNLIHGVTRLSGSEYTIDLMGAEGFVGGSRARAAFVEALRVALHEPLLRYAHDLAREGLDHGMDQDIVGSALSGSPAGLVAPRPQPGPVPAPMSAQAPVPESAAVRLAVCA